MREKKFLLTAVQQSILLVTRPAFIQNSGRDPIFILTSLPFSQFSQCDLSESVHGISEMLFIDS